MKIIEKKIIEEFQEQAEFNAKLADLTTFKIGGRAKYFVTVKNKDDMTRAVKLAKEFGLPYFVLGNGSNIVISDQGFDGLVIKNEMSELVFEQNQVLADSGITLARLIRKLAEANLGGLEFLAGIPGTLGGALYGNAGAWGRTIGDMVAFVMILSPDGKIEQIKHNQIGFQYRSTIFKRHAQQHQQAEKPIILSARISMTPSKKDAVLRLVENYIKMRSKKLPKDPSAGSFFKNIEIINRPNLPKPVRLMAIEGKIPAGALLERIGAKDLRVGGAAVASEHANFIINKRGACAADVKELSEQLIEKVQNAFNITLSPEVEFVGQIKREKGGFLDRWLKK